MARGFKGLKYEQQIQPTQNALFIPHRTKTGRGGRVEEVLTTP